MSVLFDHYFGDRDDIRLVVGINAYQLNGETIAENLEAIQLDQVLRESLTGQTQDTIIVPVNLGGNVLQGIQGSHWVALYIHFPNENRLQPFIGYFDPFGYPMPLNLKKQAT